MNSKVSPIVVDAEPGEHTATLIFFHGRGDTGHGWAETWSHMKPKHFKVICPTANEIPVTLADGCVMNAWFDLITWYGKEGPEDEPGILRAEKDVHKLIDEEIQKSGIPSERIILGGYSQGGGLAVHSALRYPSRLGGLVGISCWLPLNHTYPEAFSPSALDIPMFQCHGESDPVIPAKWSEETAAILKKSMANYTYKCYPGLGHTTCPPEMRDVRNFLLQCVP